MKVKATVEIYTVCEKFQQFAGYKQKQKIKWGKAPEKEQTL